MGLEEGSVAVDISKERRGGERVRVGSDEGESSKENKGDEPKGSSTSFQRSTTTFTFSTSASESVEQVQESSSLIGSSYVSTRIVGGEVGRRSRSS